MSLNGIIIDNFAGGGGASVGMERATNNFISEAVNHNPVAIAMHKANHPSTHHYCENIWEVHPTEVAGGRRVAMAWFSPDCKHFSRAKGGKPVDKNIRGLAWTAIQYAATVRPEVIFVENLGEFKTWGPVDKDGHPIDERKGQHWSSWLKEFRRLGYSVDSKMLVACDYGAPTIRKRLFVAARADGRPIVWPEPTHGTEAFPYHTAAECIDWSIPCQSIFERKTPLVDNTMERIARGMKKFVFDSGDPFIVPVGYGEKPGQLPRVNSIHDPLGTIVAGGVKHRLVTAFITRYFGNSVGQGVERPAPTIMPDGQGKTGVVASYLMKYRGTKENMNLGLELEEPFHTITAGGNHFAEVRAFMVKFYGKGIGQKLGGPVPTIMSKSKFGLVRAFLLKYYGTATGQDLRYPAHTLTSRARFGLVVIHGELWQIIDIGMRMLSPRELYIAQGFPLDYKIDPEFNGKPITKTNQIMLVGNSVSPHPAYALVRASFN